MGNTIDARPTHSAWRLSLLRAFVPSWFNRCNSRIELTHDIRDLLLLLLGDFREAGNTHDFHRCTLRLRELSGSAAQMRKARLKVQGQRIIDAMADAVGCEVAFEGVTLSIGHAHCELVVDVIFVGPFNRQHQRRASEQCAIA